MASWEYGEAAPSSSFASSWEYFFGNHPQATEIAGHDDTVATETTGLLRNVSRRTALFATIGNGDASPDFIQAKQQEMRLELLGIASNTAYTYAKKQAPQYVEQLQTSFLRVEGWDARRAALRMLSFFEAKLSLFGSEALGRRLSISDLDFQDKQCLKSGSFQILPSNAQSGLRVLCFFPRAQPRRHINSLMKAWWYFSMTLVDGDLEKCQKSSFVAVVYHVGPFHLSDLGRKLYWHCVCSLKQLPLKVEEWHYCYDDFVVRATLPMILYYNLNDHEGNKLKLHEGSQTECAYKLLISGVPADELPLRNNGTIDLRNHHKWLFEQGHFQNST